MQQLDKKWNTNSVTNNMNSDEYFFNFNCGGDELADGIDFTEKDTAALNYIVRNKKLFFTNDIDYNCFIKQFDKRSIINAMKSKFTR